MPSRLGKFTVNLQNPPSVLSYASVVGELEGKGPLRDEFDVICYDALFGKDSWEKAESEMQRQAVDKAIQKSQLSNENIDYIFAGDLLNQCIGSNYGLRDLGIPFIGVYGACSTMAESMGVASVFIDGNAAGKAVAVTSSHFCSAERQFRYPLEYGSQRTPNSQWTATASGAVVVGKNANPPYIKAVTFGRIQDLGINDANNMGAAMAPAAADTIKNFFTDTNTKPENYDLILTGDLGQVGSKLLIELLNKEKIDILEKHKDCGTMLYDLDNQDVNSGGSGCGCSGAVLCSHILKRIESGELRDVLFAATGALMNSMSLQQGETIPGISHLIHLSNHLI